MDPENRAHIARDSQCLPGVVRVLSDPKTSQEVIIMALEVLYYLSLSESNKTVISDHADLLDLLNGFMVNGKLQQKKIAIAIFTNLHQNDSPLNTQSSSTDNTGNGEDKEKTRAQSPLQDMTNVFDHGRDNANEDNKNTKIHTMIPVNYSIDFLEDLNDDSATKLEQLLLKIKGVISFSIARSEKRILLRATAPRHVVSAQIMDMAGLTPLQDNTEQKENQPQYLSRNQYKKSWEWLPDVGTIVSFGSLDADAKKKRAKKRKMQRQKKPSSTNNNSWFSGLSTYIWTSNN